MRLNNIQKLYGDLVLNNKQALVVGGTAGIGAGIAERLAKTTAVVTIAGRTKPSSHPGTFKECDASLLQNVRTFSKEWEGKANFLVLCQSIATIQGRTPTSEGLDVKLSLHYYSRLAFVKYLAEAGKLAEDARVLFVLSAGVHDVYENYTDTALIENYSVKNAANAAGFYTDIAIKQLAKEYPKMKFIHSSPGFVASKWGSAMPFYLKAPIRAMQALFGKSTTDCAEFMCEALFDPKLEPGFHLRGQYADQVKISPKVDEATNIVWNHTQEVLAKF